MLEKLKQLGEIRLFDAPDKKDLHNFFRHFGSYLDSGATALEALRFVRCRNKTLQISVARLADNFADGMPLSDAFELEKGVFPLYSITAVRAGTQGNQLREALRNVAEYIAQERMLEKKVKPTMRYVKTLAAVFLAVFILMVTYYLPRMTALFDMAKAGTAIRLIVGAITFVGSHMPIIAGFFLALAAALYLLNKKFPYFGDNFILKAPLYKNVYYNKVQYKIATTMAMMLGAGLDSGQSLHYTARVVNNLLVTDVLSQAIDYLTSGGRTLVEALREADDEGLIDTDILNFVRIGERNRDVRKQLSIVAGDYYTAVEEAMDIFTDNLAKIILAFGAVLLLVMAFAVYGPYLENLRSIGRMGR
jgi:type II secretory pathway component PulF